MKKSLGFIFFCLLALVLASCHTKLLSNKKNLVSAKSATSVSETPSFKFISEDKLIEYVRSSKLIASNKINGDPFNKVDYNKVIVYDYEGNLYPYTSILDSVGKFVPVVLRQQYLTQKQADRILTSLTNKSSYGEDVMSCFQPHFAIVLFKDGKFVNQINICLDCNQLFSDIEIPAQSYHKVNKGTQYEYGIYGLSAKGRKTIIDLSLEIGFRYGQRSDIR